MRDYVDLYARRHGERVALLLADDDRGAVVVLTYGALRRQSLGVTAYLQSLGLGRGDRMMLMLNNAPEIWVVTLAAIRLGITLIPCTSMLSSEDFADRVARGRPRAILCVPEARARVEPHCAHLIKIMLMPEGSGQRPPASWLDFIDARAFEGTLEHGEDLPPTSIDDELFVYFTSGTTSKPKMVLHTHQSYSVGHLRYRFFDF